MQHTDAARCRSPDAPTESAGPWLVRGSLRPPPRRGRQRWTLGWRRAGVPSAPSRFTASLVRSRPGQPGACRWLVSLRGRPRQDHQLPGPPDGEGRGVTVPARTEAMGRWRWGIQEEKRVLHDPLSSSEQDRGWARGAALSPSVADGHTSLSSLSSAAGAAGTPGSAPAPSLTPTLGERGAVLGAQPHPQLSRWGRLPGAHLSDLVLGSQEGLWNSPRGGTGSAHAPGAVGCHAPSAASSAGSCTQDSPGRGSHEARGSGGGICREGSLPGLQAASPGWWPFPSSSE